MTYYGFLAIFLGIPLAVLSVITILDYVRNRWMPTAMGFCQPWAVILALCVIAFIYTTPWDNYLVANSVWWYDINLVTGIVIGYVPIEEYTFFILQPIMTGLFLLLLIRYLPVNPLPANSSRIRILSTTLTGIIWLISVVLLILSLTTTGWDHVTYLSLELSWAFIPVMMQLAYGADILWRHKRQVLLTIIVSTTYLSIADALAIQSGTWTIDPAQSLQFYIGGILPVEEMIFFLLTNILIVGGITLILAEESKSRTRFLQRSPLYRKLMQQVGPAQAESV